MAPPKRKVAPTRRGRPPGPSEQLTTELVADITDLIEKGTFPLSAARACGVAKRTWYRWLKAAEEGTTDARLLLLWHAVEKARGRLASKLYGTVYDAALGHDVVATDAKGNTIFTTNEKGHPVPLMVRMPGQWTAAARLLESLTPDEFLRQSGGSPPGGSTGDDPNADTSNFEIVYVTSNRDGKELREITRRVEERASRV